jgi:lysophospholipase L1-like esterase
MMPLWSLPVLLVALSACAVALLGAGYARALARGRDSWAMRLLGPRVCLALVGALQRAAAPGSALRRAQDARMLAEGRSKAARLAGETASSPDAAGASRPIVLCGSSTFTFWLAMEEDVAGELRRCGVLRPPRVVNAAFGGAMTHHVLELAQELVFAQRPCVIVYYAGSNDIAGGASGEHAAAGFLAFLDRAKAALPDVRVVYLATLRSPMHRAHAERIGPIATCLQLVREAAAKRADLAVVDVVADFVSDPAHFLADQLHLLPQGHRKLAVALGPAIARALAPISGAAGEEESGAPSVRTRSRIGFR